MSDLKGIKERIFQEDLIATILQELGCQHIHTEQHGELITAQLPEEFDSQNKRAVQIKMNESLTSYIRNRGISGDIYSIIGYILYRAETFEELKEHLFQTKIWVCNALGWDEYISDSDNYEPKSKRDWNSWLRPFQQRRKKRIQIQDFENKTNRVLHEAVLNRYSAFPHIQFLKDGIKAETQRIFEIGYCKESQRITYPIRNAKGELIGVKGRYAGQDKHVADTTKYLYLYRCDKSIELYNLHQAKDFISQRKEVLVFESAKSVMLAHQFGFEHSVSIEGNEISPYQAYLLKQLDAVIVLCFDKDISLQHIQKQLSQMKSRKVYAIMDKNGLLQAKDAPVDRGKQVWETLYENGKIPLNFHAATTGVQKG